MSNSEQFSTITNSIDTDIKIIIDNKTGFYNITKINNYIYEQDRPTAIAVRILHKLMYNYIFKPFWYFFD